MQIAFDLRQSFGWQWVTERDEAGVYVVLKRRPIVGTLATRFQWVETIVEAAIERSRTKFVQALILDGGAPSLDTAERLADDLREFHRARLQDLEALAHLWRERLLLAERLVEENV